MKTMILFASIALLLGACAQKDQDDSRLQEKIAIEQKQANEVDQEALRKKAITMESDLRTRYRFYQAVANVYEGQFQIGSSEFIARFTTVPSISLYKSDRIRTVEEVTQDLANLSLSAQILIWNKKSELSATGCIFESVRPELQSGVISLINRECPNLFSVSASNGNPSVEGGDLGTVSRGIAEKVLSGELSSIDELTVTMQPTNNAQLQKFVLKKK